MCEENRCPRVELPRRPIQTIVVLGDVDRDPTTWTPATTNTAFSRTLQIGTKLVDGMPIAPFLSLVWSDSAVYLFQYTGSQFLYNSSALGVDCGLISPNAAVSVDGIAYWMGPDNFYMLQRQRRADRLASSVAKSRTRW